MDDTYKSKVLFMAVTFENTFSLNGDYSKL